MKLNIHMVKILENAGTSENMKSSYYLTKVAQMVKNLPAMCETWVQSLGWEDPLEEGMATHSSILAWRIPWTEEPCRVQSTGSQTVRHDCATKHSTELIIINILEHFFLLGMRTKIPHWNNFISCILAL